MAYTTINKSSEHFNTKLYTGNGSTQSITGVEFQPDFTWIKYRNSGTYGHDLYDAVRGATKTLNTNNTNAEYTSADRLTSFDSDGFSLDSSASVNENSGTYASWNWLANGAGSANTDGSINSTVSANTTAGFSIVKYAGSNSNATIGHGLGTTPKMFIIKNLSSARDWVVYHTSLGNGKKLKLNNTVAEEATGNFASTSPTSTVFTVAGDYVDVNQSGSNYIAYCFAEKQGYSKFGSYGGNQNADGNFIYLGFKPAFVMIKRYSAGNPTTTNWNIFDTKRDGYNGKNENLFPNTSDAESSGNNRIDMLSNGFKLRTTTADINNSGHNYIYMAFAEAPLVGTNNVPCTAR